MSGKIGNKGSPSFEAWPEEPEGLGQRFAEFSLAFGSMWFPPAALAKIFWDQFSNAKRAERIRYLIDGLSAKLKEIESRADLERSKMSEIQTRLESPQFEEAVGAACEEAARTTNLKKVERLAEVLAGSLTPTRWSPKDEDVATLIRDLAQLSDRDVDVLGKLSLAFGGLMAKYPELPSNTFTANNSSLDRIVQQDSDRDEFYSTCGRLGGFGLAIEEQWPMNHTQPHGRCIRPTRRGLALLGYLGKFIS